jgi:hypothetical protein
MKLRLRKKTFALKTRKTLVSGGWGRYGPYILASVKTGRRSNLKLSVGAKGVIAGAGYRRNRNLHGSVTYDLTTHKPSFRLRIGKRQLRT